MQHSTPLRDGQPVSRRAAPHFNRYHAGAILAQFGSFATTYAFFIAVMDGAQWYVILGIALAVEFLLTLGKSLVQRGGAVGAASIAFDTLLNAGGIWPSMRRISASPPALMIIEAFKLDPTFGLIPAFVLSLLIGYLLAVLPHRLWRAAGR
jgi:hypothetical protein